MTARTEIALLLFMVAALALPFGCCLLIWGGDK